MATILPYKEIHPQIDPSCFISPTASVIGDVVIKAKTSLWFNTVVRADVNIIRIGVGTNIQDGTVIHVDRKKYGTFIGDYVTIGHSALLHACTLQDKCFIGMQACVMDGAVIETESMVAAGALVTPGVIVKSGEIWAGRPAKFMRKMTEAEKDYILTSAQNYIKHNDEYLS